MRKTTWNITVGLVCALAASFAFAQTGQGRTENPDPPANGATRVGSPLASDPVRSWQDATRQRQQTQGADGTAGPRTAAPPSGRNGAPNSQVTLPNCQDPSAANFGSMGNCIYLPPPPPPTCTDPAATNFNQVGACVYPARCTDPAATNFNQVGACVYSCVGASTENRTSTVACPAPTSGIYTVTTQWTRSCNNGAWSVWQQGSQVASTQGTDCVSPPTTCQDPTALNFGGPLPCIARPVNVCAVNPGSADCCLANPLHASCERFNCEFNGGAWNGSVCELVGPCGMPPGWDPCSPRHGGIIDVQPGGVRCLDNTWFWCP